jgi:hypothetical protein
VLFTAFLSSGSSVPSASVQSLLVQSLSVQPLLVHSASVQPPQVQSASVQLLPVQSTSVQPLLAQSTSVQPPQVHSVSVLRRSDAMEEEPERNLWRPPSSGKQILLYSLFLFCQKAGQTE